MDEYCINELNRTALQSTIPLDSSTFQLDDFFSLNAVAAAAADVDFSSVDSFLDLSDDHHHHHHHLLLQEHQSEEEISNSQNQPENLHFTTTSFPGNSNVVVEFPLLQQVEDFEDLEWLSRIVDDNDSDSKLTLLYNPPINHHYHHHHRPSTSPPLFCFSSPIPAKPRTKRTRLAGKLWGKSAALSISSSTSSSSSTISYGSSNPSITSNSQFPIDQKNKKKKKRGWSESEPEPESETQSPRCRHCHVQKTPQWRSGPSGPKTLCNACGVRFKAGKLFPEYRPACSPSFSDELHSNSHRKVLEMRRKKETYDKPGQGSFGG